MKKHIQLYNYTTIQVNTGEEINYINSLGTKCSKKLATSFCYYTENNKLILHYYQAITINSLINHNSISYVVSEINDNIISCYDRHKNIIQVDIKEVTIIRY